MRVHVHPADEGACSFYRLREPARVLAANGHDVTEPEDVWTAAWDRHPDDPAAQVVDVHRPDCDVVVVTRPCRRQLVEALGALQRKGVAVVVEVDDLFSSIHAANPVFRGAHPDDPNHSWHWLAQACRIADLVTVTTPALAEHYGRHGRVAILPNCIPEAYLSIPRPEPRDFPLIGYAGSTATHPDDLRPVGSAVAELVRNGEATFRAIGGIRTCAILGVEGETVPGMSHLHWPQAVAQLDVGMAPLVDSAFNRAKSWLKSLEQAALGVATVASPTPEYLRAASEGMCSLASRPREWRRELRRLLDPDERAQASAAGREAASRWTYEIHASRWWEAWGRALENSVRHAA